MGTFNVAQRIDVRDKCANIDALYGPYESIAAANAAIPVNRRVIGRTVAIIEDGSAVEYWYKSGITDSDLVVKIAEKQIPTLEYTSDYPEGTVLRGEIGTSLSVTVKFSSDTYGPCTLTVYKDGSLLKTIKANKGVIAVDFGVASADGTSTYTITGVDALTIPAEETLEFKSVIGGAKISSDIQDIISSGINTSSNITITYNASVADTSKTVKVYGVITDGSGTIITEYSAQGAGENKSTISGGQWNVGVLSTPGQYTYHLYSYTGIDPYDTSGDNVTTYPNEEYSFELMNAGDFRMSSTTSHIDTDTNTAIIIPFRIYSGSQLTLQAHGEVYDSNNTLIPEYTLNRSVDSNIPGYWSIGKLRTSGTYTFKMWATTVGGEDAPSGRTIVTIGADVSQYVPQYNIVTNGLIAQFTADGRSNNNDADTRGYWPSDVQGNNIYFELNDLNYNTNGWKHVDETIPDSDPTGEMMLKMTGDSYGRLKRMAGGVPSASDPDYNPMSNLDSPASEGFTAEVIFRSRCIGELNTKVITGHTGNRTDTAGFSASFDTITVGSDGAQVRLDVAEEEWIHATMVVDKTIHTDVDKVQNYAPRKLMTLYINGSACASTILTDNMVFTNYGPVILNAALNTVYNRVEYFGSCEIKTIRFYSRPLYASEVENNYIASIYDSTEQSRIAGRNEDALPIVRFIKNGDNEYTFQDLNDLKDKSLQKKVFVCSRFRYEPVDGDVIEWDYAQVATQGTSSLQYPVKNYKITFFRDRTYAKKKKVDYFSGLGWEDESKFTLKCDFMEAAHLNNTPSCTFYNNIIDTMVSDGAIADGWNQEHTVYTAANDERSAARREGHFDAIKGFPCIVYYYESDADYASGNGVYVGSYMFNLDKSADSLGFDDAAKLGTDGETVVQIENPRYALGLSGEQYLPNICQSFEGVANGNNTAGCFYSYEDWKTSHYAEYCSAAYEYYINDLGGAEPLDIDDFIQYYSIDHPITPYRVTDGTVIGFDDHKLLHQKNAFITEEGKFASEYDYFASDFEARYDWDDLEEGGEEFWGNSSWGVKRMIDWVSSASATAGTQNDTFKSEFNQYFNFKYCALYYLQMIVFGQVDNAGKNSMWDTWDGLHWMPRPYDLDTMAGLDNTGFEVVDPDAELNVILSPYVVKNITDGTASYSENVMPDPNKRYGSYNTRDSKFWIAFAKSFATELEGLYASLRNNNIYSVNFISSFYRSMTSDIIGESYYNQDMTTKFYKLSPIETYISRMHGNRTQRFKAWMTKRIVFCDSLFNYSSTTKSLNNTITLRSDAYTGTGTVSVPVAIQVYSPQYVKIIVGTGDAIVEAYCSPDARYLDPITSEQKEGTLFTLPIRGGNKEMSISGAGNIKQLVNLGALRASSLVLDYATKINSLDLSYSVKLTALSLANNKYLQSLDCTGAVKLGTDTSGAQLDLRNCENLKYVTLDDTKLTSVVFATGGSLKTVSLRNTAITGLSLDSLHFLTSIDVTNCQNIISYAITNCPKIQSIEANELPLNTVSISDCVGLQSISLQSDNNISSISITRCPNITTLNFNNSRSSSLSTIDLTTLYGLTSLSITGAMVETIKFPKNESAESQVPWGSNFTNFSMTGSSIKYIQYGETPSSSLDMGQLTGLTSLSFQSCGSVQDITNLDYSGSCSGLFASCSSLRSISGNIECIGGADSIFSDCFVLSDFSNLTIDFSECTSLAWAFYRASWVTYTDVKRFIDACRNSLTSLYGMCYDKQSSAQYTPEQLTAYTVIPDYFFGNCKYVTSIAAAFWASGITYISDNAFVDSLGNVGLQRCTEANNAFGANYNLTSFPLNIMSTMPELVDASGMFMHDYNAEKTLPSTFFNNGTVEGSQIAYASSIFYECSKLTIHMSDMQNLLAPLTELREGQLMFCKCLLCDGIIQEGFFASNTKLTNIAGIFSGTSITGIPSSGSLFRVNGDTTSNITTLNDISSLFAGCEYLVTSPNADLFAGAPNVISAGMSNQQTASGGYEYLRGMFNGCTRITSFSKDLFTSIPRVQNLSGFFKGCSSLVGQTGGGFSADILNTLEYLSYAYEMFDGCTSLSVTSVPQLFAGCKSRMYDVSNIFRGCVGIQAFDANLFKNMTRLDSAAGVFDGCSNLDMTLTSILPFSGCTALRFAQRAFCGCSSLTGSVSVELFDDCRGTIENVSEMFKGCSNLNGTVGVGNENIYTPEDEQYQLGLLAECMKLTSAEGMFYGCTKITGSYPWDIFYTRNSNLLYEKLTSIKEMFYDASFDEPVHYSVDDADYLFHPDMFVKLIAVNDLTRLFARPSNATHWWSTSYPVHALSFRGQYFITTIREMFYNCNGLNGAVTNDWFYDSIGTLNDAFGAFAHTAITSVGNRLLRLSADDANTKLAYVAKMFHGCSSITSALPAMNIPTLYRKIDYSEPSSGYYGYAAYCVNASNYSDFLVDGQPAGWSKQDSY